MKKSLLILLCLPLIGFGQLSIGNNQTICLGDSSQIIVSLGPATIGCSGISDSLITPLAGGNGSSGTTFNLINTSGSPLDITGISQGGTYILTNELMEVWMYPGDVYAAPLPVGVPPYSGWVIVGSTTINTLGGTTLGFIPISGVTIPTGGTYSFRVQTQGTTVSYTNGVGTSGVTTYASDANITVTEGHGGSNTDWFAFTPRQFNGAIHYGGGASWIDLSTGQSIGSGDTLMYSPSQTTDICVILDCNGNTYSDTMTINVLNTNISATGFSLCNGPLILTAQGGFSSYVWNGPSTSQILTVNTPGTYYVDYITSNGMTCQSAPVTIYSGNIPISLSTPDSVFICQGDTVIIDGPIGFTTYNWNTGATTSSITTTSTGNYSLSVVDGNGCTGTSNTTSVSISPQTITATTTGYSLCNGSVTLDVGSGFASYQWFNNGVMMINTSQTLLVNTPGTYHCEVVYPTGCTAISNTLSIVAGTASFNVIISAIGADSLCAPNGQVILDAGNYASFIWSTGEITQQISVNTLGSYSVDVIDASGCQGSSNIAFEVFDAVNTSAILGPTNPTQFQTVTYYVNPSVGSTYNWTLIGGTIQTGAGTNSIDVVWNNSGMFSLSVIETNIDGCLGEEITTMISVIFSSIEEINNTKKIRKITDVLGRETNEENNTQLFYIYDDGTVEKKITIE
ncbi:MAG: hypothetical protein HOM24_03800 [Flavobacteriales bacterium]|nr:hypothetical protein [Flavobacteriales bacterium]MBT5750933.1 hypothetical protein [Flavobacteriales bacterium]